MTEEFNNKNGAANGSDKDNQNTQNAAQCGVENASHNQAEHCCCGNHSKHEEGGECCHGHHHDGHECRHGEKEHKDGADCQCKQREGELLANLELAMAEAAKNKDLYIREVASFDTYRRRMQRDMALLAKSAVIPFVEDMIPVLDNLALAMDNIRKHLESPTWAQGFEMLAKQIKQIFEKHGVVEINPNEGDEFDPKFEEAVSCIDSEKHEANKIVNVVRLGYRLDDRLIRPASVVVCKKAENK